MSDKDIYYIFIEDDENKCVVKSVKEFDWVLYVIMGKDPYELECSYSNKLYIDDIMDMSRDEYDYVEEISFSDIDDYMS